METSSKEAFNILNVLSDLGTIAILLSILYIVWKDLQTRRREYEARIDKKDNIIHDMLKESIETNKDVKEALKNNTDAIRQGQNITERIYDILKNNK